MSWINRTSSAPLTRSSGCASSHLSASFQPYTVEAGMPRCSAICLTFHPVQARKRAAVRGCACGVNVAIWPVSVLATLSATTAGDATLAALATRPRLCGADFAAAETDRRARPGAADLRGMTPRLPARAKHRHHVQQSPPLPHAQRLERARHHGHHWLARRNTTAAPHQPAASQANVHHREKAGFQVLPRRRRRRHQRRPHHRPGLARTDGRQLQPHRVRRPHQRRAHAWLQPKQRLPRVRRRAGAQDRRDRNRRREEACPLRADLAHR
ncbi:hypothetical protein D3C71_1345330 [compost metagenome]